MTFAEGVAPRKNDNRKWFALAVLISLFLHLGIYWWTGRQAIRWPGDGGTKLTKPFKVQRVEMEAPKPLPIPTDVTRDRGTKIQAPEVSIASPPAFPEARKEHSQSPTLPAPAPSAVKLPDKKTPPTARSALPEAKRDAAAKALQVDEVIAIQKESLKEKISTKNRPAWETPAGSSSPEKLPDLGGGAGTLPVASGAGEESERPTVPETGKTLSGPVQGGDSGTGVPLAAGKILPEIEQTKKIPLREGDRILRENITGERPYEQLNPWMNINLFVYEEQKNGKPEGYFMLVITAKENNILKVIPKDVFFIVDTSSSIGSGRLFEFKSGVTRSLQNLNSDDRFSLLTFKKTQQYYSKKLLPYSPAALVDVKKYFSQTDSEGRTDIYRALFPLTSLSREKNRMRMALLMSDGNANEGEKNATRIINQFTVKNNRGTSLFGLSGGKDVNKFLLEFLAYQNQGLTDYEGTENMIGQDFHKFYLSVRDPLLMDLQFKFAGTDPSEVFPRNLPHIYQNTPLKIYGRYNPETEKLFTMQILGDSFGSTKELLTRQSYEDAKRGTRQIALDWGRQKTYHLIGRTLTNDSPALQAEIQRTAQEYDVDVSFMK